MNPWLAFLLGMIAGPIVLFGVALLWARGGRVKWPENTKHQRNP